MNTADTIDALDFIEFSGSSHFKYFSKYIDTTALSNCFQKVGNKSDFFCKRIDTGSNNDKDYLSILNDNSKYLEFIGELTSLPFNINNYPKNLKVKLELNKNIYNKTKNIKKSVSQTISLLSRLYDIFTKIGNQYVDEINNKLCLEPNDNVLLCSIVSSNKTYKLKYKFYYSNDKKIYLFFKDLFDLLNKIVSYRKVIDLDKPYNIFSFLKYLFNKEDSNADELKLLSDILSISRRFYDILESEYDFNYLTIFLNNFNSQLEKYISNQLSVYLKSNNLLIKDTHLLKIGIDEIKLSKYQYYTGGYYIYDSKFYFNNIDWKKIFINILPYGELNKFVNLYDVRYKSRDKNILSNNDLYKIKLKHDKIIKDINRFIKNSDIDVPENFNECINNNIIKDKHFNLNVKDGKYIKIPKYVEKVEEKDKKLVILFCLMKSITTSDIINKKSVLREYSWISDDYFNRLIKKLERKGLVQVSQKDKNKYKLASYSAIYSCFNVENRCKSGEIKYIYINIDGVHSIKEIKTLWLYYLIKNDVYIQNKKNIDLAKNRVLDDFLYLDTTFSSKLVSLNKRISTLYAERVCSVIIDKLFIEYKIKNYDKEFILQCRSIISEYFLNGFRECYSFIKELTKGIGVFDSPGKIWDYYRNLPIGSFNVPAFWDKNMWKFFMNDLSLVIYTSVNVKDPALLKSKSIIDLVKKKSEQLNLKVSFNTYRLSKIFNWSREKIRLVLNGFFDVCSDVFSLMSRFFTSHPFYTRVSGLFVNRQDLFFV